MVFIARADGSVIINTKLNTAGFGKGASNLKGQFASLSSFVGKLGAAIGVAFSVKTIVNFSKEALELGSDLQEVQNVVDVTFTTMKQQVNEFAKNAAKTAGLSEKMAKQYVGTFGAMSKSFGFSEAEAYNMSATLTQLTGDVASFYNLTQDVAYTKLKSVFTGETESLKDLGVVMTQTALDDFAMRKGFGKTTQQMSEQEKVALRYQFVLDQLSSASGDFVRTQDGWANQTRVLKLQFEQLKATLGQGLINALTPALKMLNTMIEKLQDFAETFKQVTAALFGDASGASTNIEDSLESSSENAEQLEENIEGAGKAAQKALAGFDEINVLSKGAEENAENNVAVSGTGQNTGSTSETSVLSSSAQNIIAALTTIKEKLQSLIKPFKQFNLKKLRVSLDNCRKSFKKLGTVISEKLEWVWFNVLVPLGQWVIESAAPVAVEALSSAFDALATTVSVLFGALQKCWVYLQPVFSWIRDTVLVILEDLGEIGEKIAKKWQENEPKITKEFEDIGIVVEKVWSEIGPILTWTREGLSRIAVDTPINDLQYIIDLVSGLTELLAGLTTFDLSKVFSGIGELAGAELSHAAESVRTYTNAIGIDTDELDAKIGSWAEGVGQKFTAAWDSVKETWGVVPSWFDEKVIQPVKDAFAPIGQWFGDLWSGIETTASDVFYNIGVIAGGCWEIIQLAWQEAKDWFDEKFIQPISEKFSALWSDVSSLATESWTEIKNTIEPYVSWLDEVKQGWKDFINGIIGFINKFLDCVFGGINDALSELKNFKIAGQTPFSEIRTITVPQIPYLAKGAVIPPNAPFMAVLGDQKHGTNIEAPLDTIKQALAEVLGDRGETVVNVTFGGDLAQLARVLKPVIDTENRRKGNSLATGGVL